MKEGTQKVLSTHNTQVQRKGPQLPTSCQGPSTALQAFLRVSVTPRGLELENLTQNLAPGEEPILSKCSFCVGRYASLHMPSQLLSLQACYRGVLILTLDL